MVAIFDEYTYLDLDLDLDLSVLTDKEESHPIITNTDVILIAICRYISIIIIIVFL